MLVLQGNKDPIIPHEITDYAVNQTCALYPESSLQYDSFDDTSHSPVMYASQQIWLQRIEDRFNGVPPRSGCSSNLYQPPLPIEQYQAEVNYFLERPLFLYETA